MKFAFAIFKYFPHGGLQCDMLRMANEAVARGHKVVVFTSSWSGNTPIEGIEIKVLKPFAFSNHGKMSGFERLFLAASALEDFDLKVVFNRMAGGDVYFAADNCIALTWQRKHSSLTLKLLPRYRSFLKKERAVLDPTVNNKIIYITPQQKLDFQEFYGTGDERFLLLPPGMSESCRYPDNAVEQREAKRKELGLKSSDLMLILVGTNLKLKGGDRAIEGVASLPLELRSRVKLFLVGSNNIKANLAKSVGLESQVEFLGRRDDVAQLLLAADLMVHPARNEATGTVLIEGIAMGVPVISTAICGFSNYVADVDKKLVVPEPFNLENLTDAVKYALENIEDLKKRTLSYSANADFYSRAKVAVEFFEKCAKKRIIL